MDRRTPPEKTEQYVSTAGAGRLLGISQRTVHYWIDRGALRSWKTEGGHHRIPMSAIHALIQKRQHELEPGGDAEITVLLVEDDADLAEVFREAVGTWPFPVRFVWAADGYDGLILAGLHRPDVVISDLVMPAMDGFQMIRSLRESPDLNHALVLVVTALDGQRMGALGELPRDVPIFRKPPPFKRLMALIRERVVEPRRPGHG